MKEKRNESTVPNAQDGAHVKTINKIGDLDVASSSCRRDDNVPTIIISRKVSKLLVNENVYDIFIYYNLHTNICKFKCYSESIFIIRDDLNN